MRPTLPTARQLTISSPDFQWTKDGLLVGSPNHSLNCDFTERTPKRTQVAHPWVPVHLVPPTRRDPDWLSMVLRVALPAPP